ncbi:MAG TPA: prepilin-type N-terminal cleavage/methylation domain-containing protein [Chthoniobacteraceae bacterium]|nr:prepilin-type N-terminal cleavage/methylation domain-containing protein [Chthoniobacteraceae bacterium]
MASLRLPPSSRGDHGLTLVELLVAIACIAVLAIILYPVAGTLRGHNAVARCLSNLRQLGAGIHLYAADHGGSLPPSHVDEGIIAPGVAERRWDQFLQNADPSNYKGGGVLPNENLSNRPDVLTVYNCPANPYRLGNRWNAPSYAYNGALGKDEWRVRVANLPHPAMTVMLVDAGVRNDMSTPPELGPPKNLCYCTLYGGSTFAWERSVNFEVHHGRAHFLMVDGHVESLDRETVRQRGAEKTLLWSRDNLAISGAEKGRW